MKLRKPTLTLHGYAGVIAGILLIIIGLTGSVLVFSEELGHFLNEQPLKYAQLFNIIDTYEPKKELPPLNRIIGCAD